MTQNIVPDKLEFTVNKDFKTEGVNTLDNTLPTTLILRPSRCNNIFCPNCMPSKAVRRRRQLHHIVKTWQGVAMIVLTVDQNRFSTPLEAYLELRKDKIPEMVKRLYELGSLHSRKWFWQLEFQENGWPHWNLVVETNKLMELKSIVKAKWKYGITYVSLKPYPREQTINYAIKSKPSHPFPEWILNYLGQVRLFSRSRKLLPSNSPPRNPTGAIRSGAREPVSAAHRISQCKTETDVSYMVGLAEKHLGTIDRPLDEKLLVTHKKELIELANKT